MKYKSDISNEDTPSACRGVLHSGFEKILLQKAPRQNPFIWCRIISLHHI